ncbi:hypothetical protein AMS68_005154 [Peltaster fructicola]|uniref:Ribosomal RNA-processing protein 14/surfeit locus protein 6 C-terminal domain-containing protein n=1 Tax=Peltaster fructicola TaxID=286661 RepID=A0A6H0XXY2_9PEZI|nr:hypothetical protein AMS68_005154 [Peltaster fructicola]
MADQNDVLDGLEERLRSNSKAFESILALTPAQEHFGTAIVDGREPSEQWRAKKQTKAEKKAARKAKLDPANQISALDVMKEREKKRKRELGMEEEEEIVEQDEAANAQPTTSNKRAKTEQDPAADQAKREALAEKRRQKREKKKQKDDKAKSKREAKKARVQEKEVEELVEGDADSEAGDAIEKIDMDGMIDEADAEREDDASSAPSSPVVDSPAFDISANHSTTSSTSSIPPPSLPEDTTSKPSTTTPARNLPKGQTLIRPPLSIALPEPPTAVSMLADAEITSRTSSPKPQLPKIDQAILQERLRIRLQELRDKRKADGTDGQPARSRHELLEQRRKKADQRKAHKKELRRKAKEEEARKQEERLRGSGSPLSGADIFSPRSETNNFSFSRLAFADGTATDASLSKLVDVPRHKGPSDAKTALLAAENKQKRLAGLDEQKRADIGEKDLWLNASKRAHGERVRDDTSLLKKALKRKEKQKNKSEKEWQDRTEAVVKGKEMKQKRREDNLAKRREDKGSKKKPVKKAGKKARPGFEGRFKA